MRVSKYIAYLMVGMIIFGGCVEPYYPEIEDEGQTLVIEGLLSDREGIHEVRVSHTSRYNDPEFIPVQGCLVQVVDEPSSSVAFPESEPGIYRAYINRDFLVPGQQYKLMVTYQGKTYESNPQELISSTPIGDVYYEVESRGTTDPDITLQGLQFYTDFDIPEGYSENYRWEMEETWEYHSYYPITWYWDGFRILPPGSVRRDLDVCYKTRQVERIITSTSRLNENKTIHDQPLLYVSNETDRLKVRYSLLLKQFTLSNEEYEYWRQLEKLSQESGGLYESQPPQLRGNIINPENPDEVILGWFSVSGVDEIRIFMDNNPGLKFPGINCYLYLPLGGHPANNPFYLVERNDSMLMGAAECFDCRLLGGTLTKPDFWDDDPAMKEMPL